MLHVRPGCTFAVLLHLGPEETGRASRCLCTCLGTTGRIGAEIREETVRTVDGVRDFRGDRLVERD